MTVPERDLGMVPNQKLFPDLNHLFPKVFNGLMTMSSH